MLRADVQEDHEPTMAWFLNGLQSDIAKRLELQTYVEIGEMVDKAMKIEQILKRRGQPQRLSYTYSTLPPRPSQPRKDSSDFKQAAKPFTPRSKSEPPKGDTKASPRALSKPQRRRSRDTRCFKCQRLGHIANPYANQ